VLCVWSSIRQAASATLAFHKVKRQNYSGEVGDIIIFWCEISSSKVIEIDSVFNGYSKRKRGCFSDTGYSSFWQYCVYSVHWYYSI